MRRKESTEEQLVKEKKPAVQEQAQESNVYIGGRVTKVQLPDVKYMNQFIKMASS